MLIVFCWAEFPLVTPVDPSTVLPEILAEHRILKGIIEQAPITDFDRAKIRLLVLKKSIPKNLEEQIKENNYFAASLMFYIKPPAKVIWEKMRLWPGRDLGVYPTKERL